MGKLDKTINNIDRKYTIDTTINNVDTKIVCLYL